MELLAMNKPTSEDYAIDIHKTLEINAKADISDFYVTEDRQGDAFIEAEDNIALSIEVHGMAFYADTKAILNAIAHNHNVISGLCRRLIELEEAVLNYALSWRRPGWASAHVKGPTSTILECADRIKQAREAKRQECEQ